MLVKKFYADTSREALRLVREALGAEALILSNRNTGRGVEVVAVSPTEVEAITAAVGLPGGSAATPTNRAGARHVFPPAQGSAARASAPARDMAALLRAQPSSSMQSAPAPSAAGGAPAALNPPPAGSAPEAGFDLVHELRMLRSLVEGQLAALAYADLKRRDPARSEVLRRLLEAGFGSALAREMVDELPEGLDVPRATRLTKTRLQQRLRVALPDAGLVEAGGILALVGPTGVGKTTTVAKLAAECAIRLGAEKIALVTTDTYRIGAVDQLRIYGKIIGAPVYAIRTEADLRATLSDLRSRHLVLIDTVGMSQRDRRLADQVALLSGSERRVRRVLLLSAVSHANVLEDVVRAYRGDNLAGCILTKIDEALTLGGPLDALIRHSLTLHYVTNGQRVPEDLHRPNPLYLIERAFRDASQAPGMDETDVALTLAAGQN
jgi:flagellar biosynthesis protein FlhF